MTRVLKDRLSVLGVSLLLLATLAAFVAGPVGMGDVSAQAQPTIASSIIQLPPPVPGLDYTSDEPVQAPLADAAVAPGTPVAPASAPDSSAIVAAPDTGGSVTASLGGSDIAVSSVGGSYEVDSPKRRGNRSPRR